MVQTGLHFGFFVESAAADGQSLTGPPAAEPGLSRRNWLQVPAAGVSYLVAVGTESPRVVSDQPAAGTQIGLLESIRYEQQSRLLLAPTSAVHINGLAAPPVAILDAGDQLRIHGDWLLHVARLLRPRIGPPPPEYVGRACVNCRYPFTRQSRVYLCPYCATAYHCEDAADRTDDQDDVGALECARMLSACLHCDQPVVLEEQYDHVPQD